jgi:phosphoenolpyruvate-protein phosphotransferase (PTS system enzyme I)
LSTRGRFGHEKMTLLLDGIGISPGIAIGRIHRPASGAPDVCEQTLPPERVPQEIRRLRRTLAAASRQLRKLRSRFPEDTPPQVAEFIDCHLLMLDDRLLSEGAVEIIRERQCNAEWALQLQRNMLLSVFDEMEDPYLRTRRDDVEHVIRRLQRMLTSQEAPQYEAGQGLRGRIVVTDDLSPEDTALLHHAGVAGYVTEYGGPLSHSAILAHSMGIPAVVGVHDAHRWLHEGEPVIIDGGQGMVVAGADVAMLRRSRRRQREMRERRRALAGLRDRPAVSLDGVAVSLQLNIELSDDIRAIREMRADGVGLFRTEFLFLNRDEPPSEQEQVRAYRRVVRALRGKPLTIRTLDLGGDKQMDDEGHGACTSNPALGLRAIRRCLRDPVMFKAQLRAILRASAHGPVRLMLPMLTSLHELSLALDLLRLCRDSLHEEAVAFDPKMPVGAMIETPAAAIAAKVFAKRLDFLSIGTNDLIQYTLAIDRVDDEVNYLYDPAHPAVLRLIYETLQAGRQTGTPVAMCGEMAGDPRYTRLLLGFGLREFSTRPAALLEIKRIVQQTDIGSLRRRSLGVLRAETSEDIERLIDGLN